MNDEYSDLTSKVQTAGMMVPFYKLALLWQARLLSDLHHAHTLKVRSNCRQSNCALQLDKEVFFDLTDMASLLEQ